MYYFKLSFLFLLLFLFSANVKTQTTETDSLKAILNSNIHDTTYVQKAIDLSWLYMYTDIDLALYFANRALEMSLNGDHRLNIVSGYNTVGACYLEKAKYYEALSNLKRAEELGIQLLKEQPNKTEYQHRMASVYNHLGNAYIYLAKFQLAVENYLLSLELFENVGFERGISVCAGNLAATFNDLLKYDKALEYNFKALEIAIRTNDNYTLPQILNNIGSVYFRNGQYDSAYKYFSKCEWVVNDENPEQDRITTYYTNMAAVFHKTEQYDSAIIYFNKTYDVLIRYELLDGLVNFHYMIAQMYNDMGNYDSAIVHYNKCKKLAEQTGEIRFIMLASEMVADIYLKNGLYKLAYENLMQGSLMRDSIFNEESDVRIADTEAKYQSEKKEEKIKLLQETSKLDKATSKTNSIVFSAIIVILVLVIILVIMSYRSYKHKQLAERIKTKQNAEHKVLDAVIETEYKERKRFAEDLHDSLGVLLSTLRLYINEIDNNTTSDERKKLIEQSNSLLDDAITNARNISNNIMPAALKNNGLEIAIRSFSDKINSSGNIKIDVQTLNFKKHYKNTIEITLYRILTEMINNTLKHAEASEVNISLTENNNNNTLFITYTDNGKGFDYNAMISSSEKGMGLDNTISRINSIGGSCSINSKTGKGFSANIEVSIKNS